MSYTIVDGANGVKLSVQMLTIRERFNAFKIIPAEDQSNPLRMGWIFSALTVREIDGVPVPPITSIDDIGKLIERLDDAGLNAVQQFVVETQSAAPDEAKNV